MEEFPVGYGPEKRRGIEFVRMRRDVEHDVHGPRHDDPRWTSHEKPYQQKHGSKHHQAVRALVEKLRRILHGVKTRRPGLKLTGWRFGKIGVSMHYSLIQAHHKNRYKRKKIGKYAPPKRPAQVDGMLV